MLDRGAEMRLVPEGCGRLRRSILTPVLACLPADRLALMAAIRAAAISAAAIDRAKDSAFKIFCRTSFSFLIFLSCFCVVGMAETSIKELLDRGPDGLGSDPSSAPAITAPP